MAPPLAMLLPSPPCASRKPLALRPARLRGGGPCRSAGGSLAPSAPRTVELGKSGLMVPEMGVGVWSWGDKMMWNEGSWGTENEADARGAYKAAMDLGLNFFDTAELYGTKQFGADDSEAILGRFVKESGGGAVVATKYGVLPWRTGRENVVKTCKESLSKLQAPSCDLYQIHFPGVWGNRAYVDGLGDVVEKGLAKAAGVSNYSEARTREAHAALAARGIPLASNQVQYSILYREPETNGVLEACRELGVSVIAYSPIGSGLLTGKYGPSNPPKGPRGLVYTSAFLEKVAPLLDMLRILGEEKGGYSPMQVSLAWLMAQGNVIPIPGAKSAQHVEDIAGALSLRLDAGEVEEIRREAAKAPSANGFPAEKM